jgi:lysophospholipase L1-like esterase
MTFHWRRLVIWAIIALVGVILSGHGIGFATLPVGWFSGSTPKQFLPAELIEADAANRIQLYPMPGLGTENNPFLDDNNDSLTSPNVSHQESRTPPGSPSPSGNGVVKQSCTQESFVPPGDVVIPSPAKLTIDNEAVPISDSELVVEDEGCVIVEECGVKTSDSSPTTIVPEVVRLIQASAEADIEAASLTLGAVTAANDPVIPVNNVMSQLSAGGNVTNTATAISNTFDPVSDNNSGSATTLIQHCGPTICILPLGDSITRGTSKYPSYRYPLWVKLVESSRVFDFVGSQNSIGDGSPVFPDYNGQSFDSDHEGHTGWRADEIIASLPKQLQSYTPDIVLLHIGTNDALDNQSPQSTVNEIMQIIDVLRADNPSVKILLAKIIPTSYDQATNNRINELNRRMEELAAQKYARSSPVIVVDQNSGFSAIQDTYDGIHPNASGRMKMAQKWFQAIIKVVP